MYQIVNFHGVVQSIGDHYDNTYVDKFETYKEAEDICDLFNEGIESEEFKYFVKEV